MRSLRLTQDFHIHTHHSCDSACATMKTVMDSMESLGMEHYGISDHLHTSYNLCDLESSRHDYLGSMPPASFYFGVEVSCVGARECERIARHDYRAWGDEPIYGFRNADEPFDGRMAIGLSQEDVEALGIDYVIGGVHWPLGYPYGDPMRVIDNYYQQQVFLLCHPLVDILAHPWDSIALAAGDWYGHRDAAHIDWSIYESIPFSVHEELGALAIREHKLLELNASALFSYPPQVLEIMRRAYQSWKSQGVSFSFGSDLHGAAFPDGFHERAAALLSSWGITEDDFGLPPRVTSGATRV